MNKKVIFSSILCVAMILSITTFVHADGSSYYGLTTVGYGSAIIDQGSPYWSGTQLGYTTNPYRYMDDFGVTVWQTSNYCGSNILYESVITYTSANNPWLIQHNTRSYGDSIATHDYTCPGGTIRGRDAYAQHYWGDSGYPHSGEPSEQFSYSGTTFNDVPTSHWAYDYIETMYQIGIMDPMAIQYRCGSYSFFCPDYSVRRDEMAYFLERGMRGSNYQFPAPTGTFSDVPTYYWNAAVIEQLYSDGITAGCYTNPLRFCPENRVTRAEMAVFLLRAEHGNSYWPPPVGSSTGFADVPVTHWAAAWIKQLYAEGITGGCSINPLMYCPDNWTSRAEMAVFLQRTFVP